MSNPLTDLLDSASNLIAAAPQNPIGPGPRAALTKKVRARLLRAVTQMRMVLKRVDRQLAATQRDLRKAPRRSAGLKARRKAR